MNTDSLHAIDTSLGLMSFSSLVLTIIGVLMVVFQIGILRETRRNQAAMKCIICRMTGSTSCYNGYKRHCDDVHADKQVLEKKRH